MRKNVVQGGTAKLSDERIRAAAKIVSDAMVKSYFESSEPECVFSPEFERKMELLINSIGKDSNQ